MHYTFSLLVHFPRIFVYFITNFYRTCKSTPRSTHLHHQQQFPTRCMPNNHITMQHRPNNPTTITTTTTNITFRHLPWWFLWHHLSMERRHRHPTHRKTRSHLLQSGCARSERGEGGSESIRGCATIESRSL